MQIKNQHDKVWEQHYQEVMHFIETNKRLPSKHRPEDRKLLNWLKYVRKKLNSNTLSPERARQFAALTSTASRYRRVNQYTPVSHDDNELSFDFNS